MDSDTDSSNTNPVVDLKLIEKATHALLKHEKVRPKLENDLLSDGQPVNVWLLVSLFKFSDKPKLKPHPLYGSSTEICLITKDPQRTYKEWVAAHNVKWVHNVIGISKLRKKYIPYEAKRNLCDSYDLFLTDERILPLLPKMLGKYFFEKKKQPIPVNISKEKNFKKEILKACHCTYMYYSPGVCLSIKVGTTGMTSKQLLENLEMAIPVIVDKIPRKWKNIQSLQIKTTESISLPIYNCLPSLPIEIDPIRLENSLSSSSTFIDTAYRTTVCERGNGHGRHNQREWSLLCAQLDDPDFEPGYDFEQDKQNQNVLDDSNKKDNNNENLSQSRRISPTWKYFNDQTSQHPGRPVLATVLDLCTKFTLFATGEESTNQQIQLIQ
ncbi:11697_t:CDS:2 [Funneliformis geosporum]|uniref:Ribosomal L1 domain-containing protein 1 n=1 Tax=Funneliformis geosporum TaxID=1117311 RepID=A0A9W4SKR7_9GLOM|nr:11697_t:CDS:2 [Funneliformis geosporum]